jgi:hypothetical protein
MSRQGGRICHARGLRQGDPLSPMLFLLVMEILSALIRKVDEWSLLHQLGPRAIPHRTSVYADDLMLFIRPQSQDLQLLQAEMFRCFRGLRHNPSKCEMAPIRCAEGDIQLASNIFPCQLVDFPIKYLGIPLALGKLPKSALQPSWPLRFIKFRFNKHFSLPAS